LRVNLVLFLILISLSACSTLTNTQCKSNKWKEIGELDSKLGRGEKFYENHLSACSEKKFNRSDYDLGFREGLKEYCSINSAFHHGANGYREPEVCKIENAKEFESTFLEGRKVWDLKKELSGLKEHLNQTEINEKERMKNQSTLGKIVFSMSGNVSEFSYSQFVNEQAQGLEQKIKEKESKYPKTTFFINRDCTECLLPNVGAMLGSVTGFGIGHTLQSRYIKKGWQFSITEIGVLFIPGPGAIIGFMGLKVWEIVDLWNYTYKYNLGYPSFEDGK
jgi:hypothetical protein